MSVYPISGTIQQYAWGGTQFIPGLLHLENPDEQPYAEYWLGAHHKGPATLSVHGMQLDELIKSKPSNTLGDRVAARFSNRLPFLFKVLDARQMLSIQVHPDKAGAEQGFALEEANGPNRSAPDRNYRDDNHKPELGVALTDFYLLHGFRPEAAIRETIRVNDGWARLLPILDQSGIKGLYQYVMDADQAEIDALLQPLAHQLKVEQEPSVAHANYWAREAFLQYDQGGHHDRGIFSIFWLNLVHLKPGEGIFQDAGIPHAYLRGACLELMANSDNVLRGGLTPKHIDVPELLKHVNTSSIVPQKLLPSKVDGDWQRYPTPAPDFSLALTQVHAGGQVIVDASAGPSILLLLSGEAQSLDGSFSLTEAARTVFICAGEKVTLSGIRESTIYRASVGDF